MKIRNPIISSHSNHAVGMSHHLPANNPFCVTKLIMAKNVNKRVSIHVSKQQAVFLNETK